MNREIIARILRRLGSYRVYLVLSVLMALLSVLSSLLFPMLTGKAVDAIASGEWAAFAEALVLMLLSALLTSLFQFVMNISNSRISYSVARDLRSDIFHKIGHLPISFLDTHPHGDIVSRMISDTDQVSDGLLLGFTQLFTGVLTILGTLICMLTVSWQVTLVVVLVTPLSLLTASFIAKRSFTFFYRQSETKGEQTAFINEMVSAQHVVSAFSMEDMNKARFDEINARWARNSLLATFFSSLTNPVTRFVNSIVYAAVALSGGFSVLGGLMSVGGLSCILTYASQYAKPFNEISGVVTEFQNAAASADRIFRFLDQEEESDESALAALKAYSGAVAFEHIDFAYPGGKPLIKDFSLAVKPGMKVAIVGPTGSGKTTIINILMRFYDPDRGTIIIDGQDYLGCSRDSLRRCFAMVLQDTWLKTGTIRENILLGNPDASEGRLRKVIEETHLDTFIASLPKGLDEEVSDDTEAISAGQKQLISIARAMIADPEMLILDEATSSVDTRTELLIQEAFSSLMRGKTSFIVAHRLSTIRNADLILVMKDGNVIESGTHEELLSGDTFYSELYRSQFAH